MIASLLTVAAAFQTPAMPPTMGSKAPSFELRTLNEQPVRLTSLLRKGPVVLIVLRGYPGYQCPFCTKQVGELLSRSDEFAKRKSSVVLVYPGPAEHLKKYAGDFVAGKDIPSHFLFTLDPDFKFTNRYGLRWEAPQETSYPSTFVIAKDGRIVYAKISHSHGDRAPITETLGALDKLSQ